MRGTPPSHLRSAGLPRARNATGLLVRATVISVSIPGDNPSRRNMDESAVVEVLCDVRLLEGRTGILRDVPILRQSGGYEDHEVWIPRAATEQVNGGAVVLEGDAREVTPLTDTTGDVVLVGFILGDMARPVIVGQLAHPRTKRRPIRADGTVYRRLIRDTDVHVKTDGEVTVSRSAYTVTLNDNKVEVDYGGKKLIVDSNGVKVEGAGLEVGAAVSTATPAVMKALLAQLAASLTELATVAGVGVGGPTPTTLALIAQLQLPAATNPFLSKKLTTE